MFHFLKGQETMRVFFRHNLFVMLTLLLCAAIAQLHLYAQDTSCGIVWYPAIQLSDDTISSVCPQIAVSGDDTVHVTWKTNSGIQTMKLPYVKIVSGTVVDTKDLLQDNTEFPVYVAYPVIIARNDRVWIFFTRTSDRPLWMISSNDGGSTWSSVSAIAPDPTGRVYSPSENDQLIALLYPPHSAQPLKILRSTNLGLTWTRTDEDLDNYTKITLTQNSLHLVQHKWLDPSVEVEYRQSTDLGTSWKSEKIISEVDGWYSDQPSIAADRNKIGDQLLVAWREEKYGWYGLAGGSIISRTTIPGKMEWLPEVCLTDEPAGSSPEVALKGGKRAVVYGYEGLPVGFHVLVRSTNNSLTNFCPAVDMRPDSHNGGQRVAVSSDAVHVVWSGKVYTNHTWRIFYRRGEFIKANAIFSTSIDSMALGTTEIGRTISDTVSVMNTGSDTMIVGTAISDNENFSVTPQDTIVLPFSEIEFTVNFIPKSYGTHTGKIIFYHNSKTSPDCFDVTGTAEWRKETISYQHGEWNMVSVPVKPGPTQSLPSMFSYEGSYIPRDAMEFGKGYWSKPAAQEITYQGADVWSDTFIVRAGWNMIGSLTGELLRDNITTIPDSLILSKFYWYDGSQYVDSDTIKPGRSYWIKVKQDGKIILMAK
ncbi:MAG: hypothetical protein QME52_03490 [Bacteroidota bacterium]|nr:hypothetical protein [Bacteroidota bacterium]